MIAAGSTVPTLDLEDSSGKATSLSELAGSDDVLLYFMRTSTCAMCNRHVAALQDEAERFARRGVRVVIVVPEGADVAAQWKAKKGVDLTVVSGRTGSPSAAVGLGKRVFGSVQQSGALLVSADGRVLYAHGSTNPMASYDAVGVRAAVDARHRGEADARRI